MRGKALACHTTLADQVGEAAETEQKGQEASLEGPPARSFLADKEPIM